LDPYFRTPPFILMGAATIGWAAFNLWVMSKYPKYEPRLGGADKTVVPTGAAT
jgi:hypothetical protein